MSNVYVIDLFCGMGGFSEGAMQAGAKVILAIDNWESALEVHKNNHPDTEHWNLELGGDISEFCNKLNSFIEDNVPKGKHLHIHGSPPCQNLCLANAHREEKKGEVLIDWYIDILSHINRKNTWSMEQVRCSYTKELLKIHGGCLVEMKKFGVHNDRKRIFLGNFNDFTQACNFSEPLTLFQVLELCGETVPGGFEQTGGGRFKVNGKYNGKYRSKDIKSLSSTVTAQFPRLYKKDTNTFKMLPLNVFSYLQTFPPGYIDNNHKKGEGRHMIGNSVPPKISKLLIEKL